MLTRPVPTVSTTFTPKEQATLTRLANTLLPRLEEASEGEADENTGQEANPLYPLSASDLDVPRQMLETLAELPNTDDLAQLKLFLRLVESSTANLALAGIAKPFSRMNGPEAERYLLRLANSRLNSLRGAFRSLKALSGAFFFAGLDAQNTNPTWPILGYDGPTARPPAPPRPKPIKPLEINRNQTLECDVVIVGSGAGGGAAAGVLAAAGKNVIVVERGGYWAEEDYDGYELEAYRRMYLDRGLTTTADKGLSIQAGSCLGGGTVVNWTTSFATPEEVRQEWDDEAGWEVFYTAQYERSSRAVADRLGVSTDYNRLARRDQIMWRGLESLGWHRDTMPRNVRGCTQGDECGFCTFGCPYGAKQSTLITYLQDAYENGAQIIVNCRADRVLTTNGRASGLSATVQDPATGQFHEVTIRAKAVIAAAGAINTPALLLRSSLGGPAVGKYLRLHPATGLVGFMDEPPQAWKGVMQGAYSRQFADLDGRGYGAILETGPFHLSLSAGAIGWEGGRAFKDAMLKLGHGASIAVITRDRDWGTVGINRQGLPVARYNLSRYDLSHLRTALAGATRVLEAAGAREISTLNTLPQTYRPGDPETVEDYLGRVDRAGWESNRMAFFSYHQMGSARMGSDPQTSVVDDTNECHTTPGLFVMDGSAFPGASGVNPMLTIETIAHRAATLLAKRL